jgi:aryl-alcohol dehydrogenase-like predicted oxidoreductase
MKYRVLGRTGVRVSPLCLGAMKMGAWGNTDHDDCVRIIHAAFDAGINVVDTADAYSKGESEEILGKALRGRRESIIVATKAHNPMGRDPNMKGNSRRWLMQACDDSLRRLGTDYIDLFQLHRPDPACDIDESLGALSDLRRAGKIRYIGTSDFSGSEIVAAQWVAERRGRERVMCEQPPYSILVRGIERDVLPTCTEYGMGVLAYGPLCGGWLSGRDRGHYIPLPIGDREPPPSVAAAEAEVRDASVAALASLAAEAGLSLPNMATAWAMNHPAVSSSIIGIRTMDQLESQLAATEVVLDDGLLDAIDQIVPSGCNLRVDQADMRPLYGKPYERPLRERRRSSS